MRTILLSICFLLAIAGYSQSYVDSGIRHFNVKEYDEALVDFDEAEKVKVMFTESSIAKIYYYRGMIWVERAEERNNAEEDPILRAYENLSEVSKHDDSWDESIEKAYRRLNAKVMEEVESYEKLLKKADGVEEKIGMLDQQIERLKFAEKLNVSSLINSMLGEANKRAGDIIFEDATDTESMNKAKEYYTEAIKYFEIARYDDPFNKDTINTILELARKLGDAEKLKEYTLLLDLAGG